MIETKFMTTKVFWQNFREIFSRILRYSGSCNWCDCDRYVGDGLTCERSSCGHSWDVHS